MQQESIQSIRDFGNVEDQTAKGRKERADLVGSWEVQHQGLSIWEGCMAFNDCGYSAGKQVGYPEGV